MSLIARHINYLLRSHQCVVIPGLGAFLTNYQSAQINGSTFLPPCEVITFNPDINHDDGLLINSVARAMRVPYSVAYNRVMADVKVLERQLFSDGEIAFPNIGILKSTDGHLTFRPFDTNVVSMPYMALPQLKIVSVLEQTHTNLHKRSTHSNNHRHIVRSWSQIAASVVVLICLGILFSTPLQLTDSQQASLTQFDVRFPDNTESEQDITYRKQILNIAIPNETNVSAEVPADNSGEYISAVSDNEELHPCYLIVASLPTQDLAERFINEAANPSNLRILHADSKYRVYTA
ncbi:MAG: hypothetical protein K2M76_02810, partial [Muribaculaceae bacterium]|nr:hypothetical protein [Muribaculaceae bacterium]